MEKDSNLDMDKLAVESDTTANESLNTSSVSSEAGVEDPSEFSEEEIKKVSDNQLCARKWLCCHSPLVELSYYIDKSHIPSSSIIPCNVIR